MKTRSRVLLGAGILFIVLIASLVLVCLLGGGRLKAYTAELRARGEKVTFPELAASLSVETNNSVQLLTNLVHQLGPLAASTTNVAIHYINPGRAEVAWKLSKPPWPALKSGNSNSSWSDAENLTATVAKLRQVLKQPALNGGSQAGILDRVTPFSEIRTAAVWLACATLSDLHSGRSADALANIQAVAGLANLHREEFRLVSQMPRVAVANMGFDLTWEALQSKEWSEQQLAALQRCWEPLDLIEGLQRAMEGERCQGPEMVWFTHDALAKEARSAGRRWFTDTVPGRLYMKTVLDNDLRYQLRLVQSEVELVRELRANQPWTKISGSLDKLGMEMDELSQSPKRFLYLMTLISTSNCRKAFSNCVRAETRRRLTITAIALRRYELKYGRPAPNLTALVPEFLPAIPFDGMSGLPLGYRFAADQPCVLYSVGVDGMDGGGDPTPAVTNPKTIGLWEGKDAVWPLTAAGTDSK
jgi:hypothetical protein